MNFFLRDVCKQSKIVFSFFVFFIFGVAWCTFSKIEITPFFLWAHYSDPQSPSGKFERIYIKVNGETLDLPKLSRPTREVIQLPTEYFVQMERSGYNMNMHQLIRKKFTSLLSPESLKKMEKRLCNSPEDKNAYLYWMAKYIERVTGKHVRTLEVGTCDLFFQADRSVVRENSVSVAKFSRP